jgi:hypothetical protein
VINRDTNSLYWELRRSNCCINEVDWNGVQSDARSLVPKWPACSAWLFFLIRHYPSVIFHSLQLPPTLQSNRHITLLKTRLVTPQKPHLHQHSTTLPTLIIFFLVLFLIVTFSLITHNNA